MEVRTLQSAMERSWWMQWLQLLLVVALMLFVPFEEHRRWGALASTRRLDLIWTLVAVVVIGYMAERVWYSWRQLEQARRRAEPMTLQEFRKGKAEESLHTAKMALLLCIIVFGFLGWILRETSSFAAFRMLMWLPVSGALGVVLRSRRVSKRVLQ